MHCLGGINTILYVCRTKNIYIITVVLKARTHFNYCSFYYVSERKTYKKTALLV